MGFEEVCQRFGKLGGFEGVAKVGIQAGGKGLASMDPSLCRADFGHYLIELGLAPSAAATGLLSTETRAPCVGQAQRMMSQPIFQRTTHGIRGKELRNAIGTRKRDATTTRDGSRGAGTSSEYEQQ